MKVYVKIHRTMHSVYAFIHGVQEVLCYHACIAGHQCMLPKEMCSAYGVFICVRMCKYNILCINHSWGVSLSHQTNIAGM